MMNCKVSVIVPVYNGFTHLEKCIQSVIAQTYHNWELLLIDDGSTDSTPSVCDEYTLKDSRIIAIHISNSGVSNARNVGLDHATGDWISFIDADDYVKPMYIETLLNDTSSDCVWGGYISIPLGKKYSSHDINYKDEEICEFLADFTNGYPWGKLFKRTIIENYGIRFATDLHVYEDMLFCLQYLSKADSVKLVPDCNYYYLSPLCKIEYEKFILSEEEIFHIHTTLLNELNVIYSKYKRPSTTLKIKMIGHYSMNRVYTESSVDNYNLLAKKLYDFDNISDIYSDRSISPVYSYWKFLKNSIITDDSKTIESKSIVFMNLFSAFLDQDFFTKTDRIEILLLKEKHYTLLTALVKLRYGLTYIAGSILSILRSLAS